MSPAPKSWGGMDSRQSWIVAVACFFVQVLTVGLIDTSGLLFVATISRFDTTREKASLPFSIHACLRSAVGPLVGLLGRRIGIRLATLMGCILSAISAACCFGATNILEFTLLWGVVFGISLGLGSSLLNVILNEHFDKNLVKANGLAISGTSLGTLLLSPVVEHSVKAYGLSGTFLIISGLMLNSIPAMIIMIIEKPTKTIPSIAMCETQVDKTNYNTDISSLPCKQDINQIPFYNTFSPAMPPNTYNEIKNLSIICSPGNETDNAVAYSNISASSLALLDDSVETRNLSNAHSANITNENKSIDSNTSPKNSKWQLRRLFSEPIYVIFIIGSGLYSFIISTYITIIVDYATDLGIPVDYSTYIVMWIALCDIGGFMFLSWIIELKHMSQCQFASASFLCLCLASVAMTWCSQFVVLLVLICVFEVARSGVIILATPLVAEYMDADLHATGIASLNILSSPLTLATPPLIGYFRDGQASYNGVFYVISACSLLCSLLFLCIPKLQIRRHRKQNDTM